MCGIVGVVDRAGVDEDRLARMRDTMRHRGPDDAGIWIASDRAVALAHRRLSIIDLSSLGHQPMSDSGGTCRIVLNGEVYNFLELRKELQGKGHAFRSRTDTEVVLEAYKEWGTDCLGRLNGMFAFCIHDARDRTLFIARDRVGKKPLYYSHSGGRFVFASELKAIAVGGFVPREIDLLALNDYLTFGYIGGERCIFKDVRKLPPAHAMVYQIDSGAVRIWRYWEPPPLSTQQASESALLAELERLLEDAVRLRMISDVPLGAFLSGGIDSSLVVAMMCRVAREPVKTYSIGFAESRHNELPYARIVADHFHTDHHEIIVTPDAFAVLPSRVGQFDEPFADASMIPTYYVSKATRDHVKVALSGDGGDELFGGYRQYRAMRWNYYAARYIPGLIRKGIAGGAAHLPDAVAGKRQLQRLEFDPLGAFIDRSTHSFFKERYRRPLLKPDLLAALGEDFSDSERTRRACAEGRDGDFISRLTYTDFKTYLPDDIMVKVDRASMLVSLEARAPFLDYRIAEFASAKVPGGLKVKGQTTKYLLKKLAGRLLPTQLDTKRKWGFSLPIDAWFRGPLYPRVRETILEGCGDYFAREYVEKLLRDHKAGVNHSGRLFALLVLSIWEAGSKPPIAT